MKIRYLIWLDYVEDKIAWKHNVTKQEVNEVLRSKPRVFFRKRGEVEGENLYNALGRTEAGRHLSIFFIHKRIHDALVRARNEQS